MTTHPPSLNTLLDLPPDADAYARAAALRRHPDAEALIYVAWAQGLYASPEAARAVFSRLATLHDTTPTADYDRATHMYHVGQGPGAPTHEAALLLAETGRSGSPLNDATLWEVPHAA